MKTKYEALKMAIEAMEIADAIVWEYSGVPYEKLQAALQICKEALADNSFCKHGLPRGICTLGEKDCE